MKGPIRVISASIANVFQPSESTAIATHSETREEMVVYRALYGERGVWVRPASMWNEVIERDGKTYRRFTYIGEGDA